MKRQYSAFLILVFVLVFGGTAPLLTSCKSGNVLPPATIETNKETKIQTTEHDSLFKTKPDNSYYQAYLDCINGKVVLRDEKTTPSANGALQPPKAKVKNNTLYVDCDLKEQELHAKWKSENKQEIITVTKTVPVSVPRQLTFWQQFQIYGFQILSAILIIIVIIVCIRLYLKSINPI